MPWLRNVCLFSSHPIFPFAARSVISKTGRMMIGDTAGSKWRTNVKKSIALELLGGNIDGQTDVFFKCSSMVWASRQARLIR